MSQQAIDAVVAPIIAKTYGDNGMSRALVAHLTERITDEDWDSRGREYMVMLACWDWFSGGGTADGVAKQIEAALGNVKPLRAVKDKEAS